MAAETSVIGLFKDEHQVVSTIEAIRDSAWSLKRVLSPIPNHHIMDALRLKKSKVGYYTLAGGILGFFFGFLFAIYCSSEWKLIVSGKPVIALVPFFVVGFEFTVLFAVFGNVIGLINEARLPDYKGLADYHPKCSGEYYGIVATCAEEKKHALMDFFRKHGAEVEEMATESTAV
jgi:molybdopterin-containing oxidoreductase family membrane subunit